MIEKFRIKEWDYYAILSMEDGYGRPFTMADMGYIGSAVVCWLDFKDKNYQQLGTISNLPMGKMGFPATPEKGEVTFSDKKIRLRYSVSGSERKIQIDAPGYVNERGDKGLKGEFEATF